MDGTGGDAPGVGRVNVGEVGYADGIGDRVVDGRSDSERHPDLHRQRHRGGPERRPTASSEYGDANAGNGGAGGESINADGGDGGNGGTASSAGSSTANGGNGGAGGDGPAVGGNGGNGGDAINTLTGPAFGGNGGTGGDSLALGGNGGNGGDAINTLTGPAFSGPGGAGGNAGGGGVPGDAGIHGVAKVPVGTAPVWIAANPVANTVYAVNFVGDSISVIDTTTNARTNTIDLSGLGVAPVGVGFSPDGLTAYVAQRDNLTVIDTSSETATSVAALGFPGGSWGLAVEPTTGTSVYIADQNNNLVSIVTVPGYATTSLGASPGSVDVAFTLDGSSVYVTNHGVNTVSVIDAGNPSAPWDTIADPSFNYPLYVAANPDAGSAAMYVSNFYGGTVSVVDTGTEAVTDVVPVGANPIGVVFSPTGNYAYVANYGSNSVSVIDTGTKTVVKTIPAGLNPYGITISTDGGTLFVANNGEDTVWAITLDNGL